MSLATRVLIGLGLGVVTGLFFGESVAFLEVPGNAFVVLLQMTVLPFVSVALIHSLGRLSTIDARTLARYAGTFLLLIWAVTLSVVVTFPLAFPGWEAASFFSTSLVEEAPAFDPLALYLPSNPFKAFADGIVPAVVVFSVAVGLSLMLSDRKQALLESLGTLEETLQRIAGFVVELAPYGVFAIAGHAAGTMRTEEFLGLQVYAAAYVCAALARDLGVSVEFVRIVSGQAPELLDSGAVDVVMGGFPITPMRMQRVAFSTPYLEETLCFIVSDHRREEFGSHEAVQSHEALRLAIPASHYYAEKIRSYLPRAELVEVASPREFFSGGHEKVDGLIYTAESGSAWTLIYPQFSVAVPHPKHFKVPLGYATRRGDPDLLDFLNHWIHLKHRDLTIPSLFSYWFQGITPSEARQPRWSILSDVILGGARGRD